MLLLPATPAGEGCTVVTFCPEASANALARSESGWIRVVASRCLSAAMRACLLSNISHLRSSISPRLRLHAYNTVHSKLSARNSKKHDPAEHQHSASRAIHKHVVGRKRTPIALTAVRAPAVSWLYLYGMPASAEHTQLHRDMFTGLHYTFHPTSGVVTSL